MGDDLVSIARRMYDAWNEGNVDRMIDFWTEDGDWRWEDAPDFPGAKSITGRAAVEAHLREVMSLLGSLQIEVEEMTEIDGEVLAVIRWRIRGAHSGVELEDSGAHLVDFENGRVRSFRLFRDREQALEAAKRPG
jgi:ketosteroid isomerase-like protein